MEKKGAEKVLADFDGIVVPGGFGSRGTEGMVETVKYARENKCSILRIMLRHANGDYRVCPQRGRT